ncbi:hypothetical protein HUW51_14995 [Adhaeribacter swui]|uniref:Uncharacterized protein n=1 Tax=Adhaeribacter swui TaxID=2086471 RepID=A0A7G7G9Y0_9BACT|nr:hypothetical protein [Adhaeribacter swui]QNF33964.1 hypothetical protein HUW51_14995 [Adhaeribacter swui]
MKYLICKATRNHHYTLLTSDYWLSKDDLIAAEFEAELTKELKTEEII